MANLRPQPHVMDHLLPRSRARAQPQPHPSAGPQLRRHGSFNIFCSCSPSRPEDKATPHLCLALVPGLHHALTFVIVLVVKDLTQSDSINAKGCPHGSICNFGKLA